MSDTSQTKATFLVTVAVRGESAPADLADRIAACLANSIIYPEVFESLVQPCAPGVHTVYMRSKVEP